jgi:glyceraldehyde-3-phosphate dehydrogenase (NADP+)
MVLVDRKIRDRFLQRLCDAVDRVAFGMPWEEGVLVTPLPDMPALMRIQALLEDALQKGAKIMNRHGGKTQGSFFFPAVLFPVLPSMRLYHEEQFGPLIPVIDFQETQEAIDYIAHSPYGQQASVFAEDATTMASLTDALVNQVCRINVNAECQRSPDTFPFNGRKDSAEGTLSVFDALRTFSIRTIVATPHTKNNQELIQTILRTQGSSFISTNFIL